MTHALHVYWPVHLFRQSPLFFMILNSLFAASAGSQDIDAAFSFITVGNTDKKGSCRQLYVSMSLEIGLLMPLSFCKLPVTK